ncbi:MAG: MFS transporter [Bdellovibrionales bacterium]|nr:MFS transporter [Bdellovibrionales bacterium]
MAIFSLDVSPLKENPNYRWLYISQLISFFGSMITYVAIPFQMYEITGSTFQVGLLGIVQLIPLIISGFYGGALADSFDRRKLVIVTEIAAGVGNLLLMGFALSGSKSTWVLYVLSGLMAIFRGLERPALEALTQQLIKKEEIPKVSSLQSFKTTAGMIMGPAVGGILIASFGIVATYVVDFLTYVVSIYCLLQLKNVPLLSSKRKADLSSIMDGFRYAFKRPDLIGTYVVDMASMTFAYPNPLFPAMAKGLGGADKLGWLYSSIAIGAFIASLTSGWTHKIAAHGKIITICAFLWCVGIVGFGLSHNFYIALFALGFAGFVDMISGIFRATIWNETIPGEYRGRLASVEMISYSSGPLLGNTFMGAMADGVGFESALMWGGIAGGFLVLILGVGINSFWNYKAVR